LHGIFESEGFRRSLLSNLKPGSGFNDAGNRLPSKDEIYDRLAGPVRQSLDIGRIYRICGLA